MRVAIVSDLHANLPAVEAVGDHIASQDVDETWCLGDVVGYGAEPRETFAWVEAHAKVMIKGNHDQAVAAGELTWFNPAAAQAARWHAQLLTPPERTRIFGWPEERWGDLRGLPTSARPERQGEEGVLLVHGSPDDRLREYVTPADAPAGLDRWAGRARVLLLGHTHLPFVARFAGDPWSAKGFREDVVLEPRGRAPLLILNPGSVGQPRDHDPRASYAVLDLAEQRAELHRVKYDVGAEAEAILAAGLPATLADRLAKGR